MSADVVVVAAWKHTIPQIFLRTVFKRIKIEVGSGYVNPTVVWRSLCALRSSILSTSFLSEKCVCKNDYILNSSFSLFILIESEWENDSQLLSYWLRELNLKSTLLNGKIPSILTLFDYTGQFSLYQLFIRFATL